MCVDNVADGKRYNYLIRGSEKTLPPGKWRVFVVRERAKDYMGWVVVVASLWFYCWCVFDLSRHSLLSVHDGNTWCYNVHLGYWWIMNISQDFCSIRLYSTVLCNKVIKSNYLYISTLLYVLT